LLCCDLRTRVVHGFRVSVDNSVRLRPTLVDLGPVDDRRVVAATQEPPDLRCAPTTLPPHEPHRLLARPSDLAAAGARADLLEGQAVAGRYPLGDLAHGGAHHALRWANGKPLPLLARAMARMCLAWSSASGRLRSG